MTSLNGKGRTVTLADGEHTVHFTGSSLMDLEKECGSWAALLQMAGTTMVRATALLVWASGGADDIEAAAARLPVGNIQQVGEALIEELTEALGWNVAVDEAAAESGVDPTTPPTRIPGTTSTATRG